MYPKYSFWEFKHLSDNVWVREYECILTYQEKLQIMVSILFFCPIQEIKTRSESHMSTYIER